MLYPKVCVNRVLTEEQKAASISAAMSENPNNRQELNHQYGRLLAVQVSKLWKNGRAIQVGFLNGDEVQHQKCEEMAHKWETYANIKFIFDQSASPEIRVAFNDGGRFSDPTSWSCIGTDCLIAHKDEQTINLGWLTRDSPDEEWERVTVHEFGHALGCLHEDQSPAESIQYDEPTVYAYYMGPPNNWTRQMVQENILNKDSQDGIKNTPFDPTSIEAYWIDPEFTLDKKGVEGGKILDTNDKALIGQMYPFPVKTKQVIEPGQLAINGTLDSTHTINVYSLPARAEGTYRVWSSFIAGMITVRDGTSKVIAHARQQATFKAVPGEYSVTVSPETPGLVVIYRIVARKIS